jgi:pimeloyl-ACP methyl ester carboxylesterase
MLRIASGVVTTWFLIAPLTAIAANTLHSIPVTGNATDRAAQHLVQNDSIRSRPSVARKDPQARGPTEVYLLRGFMNVFSLGMDDLAAKLQADGISATVMNHADAEFLADRILTTYNTGGHSPIVLIGHSLGADAIVTVAETLGRNNIPVALLVLFDGTEPHQISANVATAINYTKHFMITPESGSRSLVSNVDLSGDPSIDHLSIDATPSLQAQTLDYVLKIAAAATHEPPSSRRK